MMAGSKPYRAALVACARWEEDHVAEWVRYHAALGFDRFHLICNDDDPAAFRAALATLPDHLRARVCYRPFFGQGRQRDMYLDVLPKACAEADWICILDIDEFLVLRRWTTVGQLIDTMMAAGMVSMHFNWLLYGHNGYAARPGGSVLRHYTRRARKPDPHTKHLSWAGCFEPVRLTGAGFPFWHALTDPAWHGFRRGNVLGDAVEPLLDPFPAAMGAYMTEERSEAIVAHGFVAHFSFKSEEDFRRRIERGTGGGFAGQVQWADLAGDPVRKDAFLAAMNEVEDSSLADLLPAPEPPTLDGNDGFS